MKVYVIGITTIVSLMALLSVQSCRLEKAQEQIGNLSEGLEVAAKLGATKSDSVQLYVNRFGEEVAKNEASILELSTLRKMREADRLKFLKQFEGLKKNLRNLENASSVELFLLEDSVPSIVSSLPCKDSIKVFVYSLVDEFNTIQATVIDTPKVEVRVPLYSSVYWQRKKILGLPIGKKTWKVESYTPNKLVRISRQQFFIIGKSVGR